jgi:hypothetical protein
MCFRVAVRQVEAWLLADRERIAPFSQCDTTGYLGIRNPWRMPKRQW